MVEKAVESLTEAEAREELARLAGAIAAANTAYHRLDAPEISDADYDALKRRALEIEARFPALTSPVSPSQRVGAPVSTQFAEVTRCAHPHRQLGRAPVAGLLRLGQVDPDQLAHHILQPVAVGVGAGQSGGDLGAIDRPRLDPEVQLEHADVEPAEVEQLQHLRIGQQAFQVGAVVAGAVHAHDMGVAVAGRQLDHAQGIAAEAQAHGLGIDGDVRSQVQVVGRSTRPSTPIVHVSRSIRGVASAVSTGQPAPVSYCPGGRRSLPPRRGTRRRVCW